MEQSEVLFGLIGFPLGHSWSAAWFNEKFRKTGEKGKEYRLFPLHDLCEFEALLRRFPTLSGLNVTIPYKEKIIPYLDELDETARSIGAVNTIKVNRSNGIINTIGYNTDAPGFLQTLTDTIPQSDALILGTGGAAKAIACALNIKKIPFTFVSRNKQGKGIISYQDLSVEIIQRHLLIINATPLGTFPDTNQFPPIPYNHLSSKHFLYDLTYNPPETEFLKHGHAMNTRIKNGERMLINQAELSYQIFTSRSLNS
jgi:shikimate dehydrogenase